MNLIQHTYKPFIYYVILMNSVQYKILHSIIPVQFSIVNLMKPINYFILNIAKKHIYIAKVYQLCTMMLFRDKSK